MEEIRVSKKELARQDVLLKIDRGEMTMTEGAAELGISVRQLRRSRRRHEDDGLQGLAHKGRGKASGRAIPTAELESMKRLLHDRYPDFGPTHATEKLCIDLGRKVSKEKVRQLLIEEGLHHPKKRRAGSYHPRRKRRSCEGELVQSDGSLHDWLEGRAPKMTLITFVDDATSKIKHAGFVPSESTAAYMRLTKRYVELYGRPKALYVDKHSIFRQLDKEARERGEYTNFGRALSELDIELICANSPQAKGRVERSFNTLQNRLVKEMRLAGVCSMEQANEFLSEFLEDYNRRFAIDAAQKHDAHRALTKGTDLRRVFSSLETRKLSKTLCFSYEGVTYQVEESKLVNRLRYRQVEIRTTLEREMMVVSSWGQELKFSAYTEPEVAPQRTLDSKELERLWVDRRRKPGKYHPWR